MVTSRHYTLGRSGARAARRYHSWRRFAETSSVNLVPGSVCLTIRRCGSSRESVWPPLRAFHPCGSRLDPVLEAGDPFLLEAVPPDIGPVTGDPHRLRSVAHGPTPFDALAQTESTFGGEGALRCIVKPPWRAWGVVATHSPRRLQRLVDPVGKACGHST